MMIINVLDTLAKYMSGYLGGVLYTVKNNSDQNPARIWITPHYAVIAGYLSDGFASILELEENPEISGFSKKLPNI